MPSTRERLAVVENQLVNLRHENAQLKDILARAAELALANYDNVCAKSRSSQSDKTRAHRFAADLVAVAANFEIPANGCPRLANEFQIHLASR